MIAALFLAFAAPSATAARWGPEYTLVPAERSADLESLTFDRLGNTTVVYLSTRPVTLETAIEAMLRPPGGAFGAPVQVSGPDPGQEDTLAGPYLERNARGAALVRWDELLNIHPWLAVYRPGRGFGPPQRVVAKRDMRGIGPAAATSIGTSGHGAALYGDRHGVSARLLPRGAMRLRPPVRLAGTLGGRVRALQPGVSASGGVIAAWSLSRGRRCDVYTATLPSPRAHWRVSRLAVGCAPRSRPVMAVNENGQAALTWRGRRTGLYSAVGSPRSGFGTPQRVARGGARSVMAMDARGGVTLAFAQKVAGEVGLMVAVRAPGGRFGEPVELASGEVGPGLPVVRMNRAGDTAIEWPSGRLSWVVTRSRETLRFSSRAPLSRGGRDARPNLVLAADGTVVVAWREPRRDRIRGTTWRAGALPPEAQVLGPGHGRCFTPTVVGSPNGHVVVAWLETCGSGETGAAVWAAVLRPGGAIEPGQQISPNSELGGSPPQLAVERSGRAILTWIGSDFKTLMAADLEPD